MTNLKKMHSVWKIWDDSSEKPQLVSIHYDATTTTSTTTTTITTSATTTTSTTTTTTGTVTTFHHIYTCTVINIMFNIKHNALDNHILIS